MQLYYGDYAHDANSVQLTTRHEILRAETGARYGFKKIFNINGEIYADTQAELTTALDALVEAYSSNGEDLILKDNSANDSHITILNADSASGVMITDGPNYPNLSGAEYTTFVTFSIAAEAEFITGDDEIPYETYTETIAVVGNGGPKRVAKAVATGAPVRQQTRQRTVISATQSGTATKTGGNVPPPFPLLAFNSLILINETISNPVTISYRNGVHVWTINWNRQFESATPLIGIPVRPF